MDQRLARQYSTSANLAARIELHRLCSTNPYGFQRWVFDRLGLTAGQRVLELGCGTGNLWRENLDRIPVRPLLTDFSMSMIRTTADVVAADFVNCALPELPFASDAFDVVIANHMLYHVADRNRALGEIRRVLHRGGVLFAATNGETHMREIRELMREFAIEGTDFSASFTLENGEEQLRRVFPNIEREDYPDGLRITDADLLVRYVSSIGGVTGGLRDAVESRIARDGAFHVTKSTGVFVARNV